MATTGLQLCSGCTESANVTSLQDKGSYFFKLNVTIPNDIDADVLGLLAKCLCSQCGKNVEREATKPMDTSPHLFATNRKPVEAEEAIISARLRAAEQELSVAEALFVAAEDQLRKLKERRDYLADCTSQCRRLLSPIRRLPREVLIEIAKLTVPVDSSQRGGTLDVKSGVWPLTQVCSSWRAAILNAPTLWSIVDITTVQPRYSAAILYESIKRSQCVALDVTFASEETELSKLLFQIVCSQSERWQSLELRIHPSHLQSLDQVRDTLIRLRTLKFYLKDSQTRPASTRDYFAFAPNLHNVDLGWMTMLQRLYTPPHVVFQLPEGSITTFAVCVANTLYHRLPDIIPRSATSLSLGAGTPIPPQSTVLVPTLYPSVTSLEVCRAPWLVNALTCPGLTEFTIYALCVGEVSLNSLRSFVDRSIPLPESFSDFTLRLSSVSCPSDVLVRQLYQTLRFTTELSVKGETMRMLNPLMLTADRSQDCLPALRNLEVTLEDAEPNKDLYTLIHTVIDSRVKPPANYNGEKLSTFVFTDSLPLTNGRRLTLEDYDLLLQWAVDFSP